MIKRLRDWLRARAHQHAVAAAQGLDAPAPVMGAPHPYDIAAAEGEGMTLTRVAAQPELDVFGTHPEVLLLDQPAEDLPPVVIAAVAEPLGQMGHEVAMRMEQVMTNLRVLTQLQFLDTVTVRAIDEEIRAIDGGVIPANAAHLAALAVIFTMLSDALGYAGNMHRLLNIYNAAPEMHAAADYLLSLRVDPAQPPTETRPPYLPIAGGDMFGPLLLNADPRSPREAVTRRYVDALVGDLGHIVGDAVIRSGDTMTGPLVLSRSPPVEQLEAAAKSYVDTLLSGAGYQGAWQVAANTPDLNPPATAPLHGFRWLCLTVDPAVPENAPAGMPGIGGQPISNGSFIVWDGPLNEWHYVHSGGLTLIEADARYLQLTGGTLIGQLLLDASAHVQQVRDGFGYLLNSGGGLYKRVGSGVVLRQSSGNQQPQIEANNGSAARDIIDTTNGDARYAGRASAWVDCVKTSTVQGMAQVRYEENGSVVRLRYNINKAGSLIGNAGQLFTIPINYTPVAQGFVGMGKNKGLDDGGWHQLRITGSSVFIDAHGGTQDASGDFTWTR